LEVAVHGACGSADAFGEVVGGHGGVTAKPVRDGRARVGGHGVATDVASQMLPPGYAWLRVGNDAITEWPATCSGVGVARRCRSDPDRLGWLRLTTPRRRHSRIGRIA
jgi:hypothetical protein